MIAEKEESGLRHALLNEAMADLNDCEKHILTERRLRDDPLTLEELSQQYGVSRERVRQIEVRAFEKLQKALMRLASDRRLLPSPAYRPIASIRSCAGSASPATAYVPAVPCPSGDTITQPPFFVS